MEKLTRISGCGLMLAAVVFSSCGPTREVAVRSFRVIDAPAAYIRRQIDSPEQTTTTTETTTVASDAYQPGHPVYDAPPPPPPRRVVTRERTAVPSRSTSTASTSPRVTSRSETEARPRATPSATPRIANAPAPQSQPAQLPYAKPVPGKAGYVFSPFDPNGGYVDVNGYTPGSKVKDPYSGKIFLVP